MTTVERIDRETEQIRQRLMTGKDSPAVQKVLAERAELLRGDRARHLANPGADPFARLPQPMNEEAF